MKNRLYCKFLAVGIIVLFIGVSVSSAVDVNTEVDEEAWENFETEPFDEYTERISFVWGSAAHRNRTGLFSVNFTDGEIVIISFTTSGFYGKNVDHVYMDFFIGHYPRGGLPTSYHFIGVAIGNIDW
jgi:hypothetical protein